MLCPHGLCPHGNSRLQLMPPKVSSSVKTCSLASTILFLCLLFHNIQFMCVIQTPRNFYRSFCPLLGDKINKITQNIRLEGMLLCPFKYSCLTHRPHYQVSYYCSKPDICVSLFDLSPASWSSETLPQNLIHLKPGQRAEIKNWNIIKMYCSQIGYLYKPIHKDFTVQQKIGCQDQKLTHLVANAWNS